MTAFLPARGPDNYDGVSLYVSYVCKLHMCTVYTLIKINNQVID